jgi:hypothetical protein
MDRSSLLALVVGGVALTAGLVRLVERFRHIAWHGDEQGRTESEFTDRPNTSLHF